MRGLVLPVLLRFPQRVHLREVAERFVETLPAHSHRAVRCQRDVLFVNDARADKPAFLCSLEVRELGAQGADSGGGEHCVQLSSTVLAATPISINRP